MDACKVRVMKAALSQISPLRIMGLWLAVMF